MHQDEIIAELKEHCKDFDIEEITVNPSLYGDFRTALDEAEPRIYEDMLDFESCKAIFMEVFTTLFIYSVSI